MALDAALVPRSARHLIPFAERWGIGDDYEREVAVAAAGAEDLSALAHVLDDISDEFWEWLGGDESFAAQPTREYVAMTALTMAVDSARAKLQADERDT